MLSADVISLTPYEEHGSYMTVTWRGEILPGPWEKGYYVIELLDDKPEAIIGPFKFHTQAQTIKKTIESAEPSDLEKEL